MADIQSKIYEIYDSIGHLFARFSGAGAAQTRRVRDAAAVESDHRVDVDEGWGVVRAAVPFALFYYFFSVCLDRLL